MHLSVLCVRAVVGELALKLKGDFTWEESAAPSLTNLEVSVDSGDLMVVVGSTGSGKSSLLGAALGLMQQVEGEPVNLRGKASALHSPAYCCLSVKSLVSFSPVPTGAFWLSHRCHPCTYLAHHEPESVNIIIIIIIRLLFGDSAGAQAAGRGESFNLHRKAGALGSSACCCPLIRCN